MEGRQSGRQHNSCCCCCRFCCRRFCCCRRCRFCTLHRHTLFPTSLVAITIYCYCFLCQCWWVAGWPRCSENWEEREWEWEWECQQKSELVAPGASLFQSLPSCLSSSIYFFYYYLAVAELLSDASDELASWLSSAHQAQLLLPPPLLKWTNKIKINKWKASTEQIKFIF